MLFRSLSYNISTNVIGVGRGRGLIGFYGGIVSGLYNTDGLYLGSDGISICPYPLRVAMGYNLY